jgi:hypothetical protein
MGATGFAPVKADEAVAIKTFDHFCMGAEIAPAAILASADSEGWSRSAPALPILADGFDPTASRTKTDADGRTFVLTVTGEASVQTPSQAGCGLKIAPPFHHMVAEARRHFGLDAAPLDTRATTFFLVRDHDLWGSASGLDHASFLTAARAGRFRAVTAFDGDQASTIFGIIDRSPPTVLSAPHP